MRLDPLPELACREVVELFTEYLSGALSADQLQQIETHLGDCSPCTQHLAQLKATIALTAELGGSGSAEVSASLLESFRALKRR